jgi:hypothetical protein
VDLMKLLGAMNDPGKMAEIMGPLLQPLNVMAEGIAAMQRTMIEVVQKVNDLEQQNARLEKQVEELTNFLEGVEP